MSKPCQWPGDRAHSNDTVLVFRGEVEPLQLCGYHAMRWELGPDETRQRLLDAIAAAREEVLT